MNRIILSGLVLTAIVAVVFCELCTPDQWEGFEGSIGGYEHHRRPGIIKEHNMVSYDATNQRKASFINYRNNEYENKFQMIVRYGDDGDEGGKAYVVDLKKGKCWTKKLEKPFRKCCLPDDAKKVHSYSLGLKGTGGLEVTGYEVKKKEMEVFLSVASAGDKIIPVLESVHGHFGDTSFLQEMQYAEITPGIKNASVFDIPKECKEEVDVSITDYLMREHFIFAI